MSSQAFTGQRWAMTGAMCISLLCWSGQARAQAVPAGAYDQQAYPQQQGDPQQQVYAQPAYPQQQVYAQPADPQQQVYAQPAYPQQQVYAQPAYPQQQVYAQPAYPQTAPPTVYVQPADPLITVQAGAYYDGGVYSADYWAARPWANYYRGYYRPYYAGPRWNPRTPVGYPGWGYGRPGVYWRQGGGYVGRPGFAARPMYAPVRPVYARPMYGPRPGFAPRPAFGARPGGFVRSAPAFHGGGGGGFHGGGGGHHR